MMTTGLAKQPLMHRCLQLKTMKQRPRRSRKKEDGGGCGQHALPAAQERKRGRGEPGPSGSATIKGFRKLTTVVRVY